MDRFFSPLAVDATPAARIVDRVAAGLCLCGALLYPFVYGAPLAFGMVGFYVALQSGTLHAVRFVAERQFPPSARFATAGVAMGLCFSLHAFMRGLQPGAYLEYVGGPPVTSVVHGIVVGLNHVVVPLAALVHLRGAPPVHPLWPMLLVLVEVTAVALLHELVVTDVVARDVDDGRTKAQLLISSAGSAAAWTLLLETLNRFFVARRRL